MMYTSNALRVVFDFVAMYVKASRRYVQSFLIVASRRTSRREKVTRIYEREKLVNKVKEKCNRWSAIYYFNPLTPNNPV